MKTNTPYLSFLLLVALLSINLTLKAQTSNAFTASSTKGCLPLTTQFNCSVANAASYYWDFGNGNSSTMAQPSNMYTSPGKFQVTLEVTYSNGAKTTFTSVDFIEVFARPTAEFSNDATSSHCEGQDTVRFTNLSSPFTNALWDMGDGSISYDQNPTHVYGSAGTYHVTLIVTDTNGCSSSITKQNEVSILPTPKVNFTLGNQKVCNPGDGFQLNNNTLSANSYLWNFGDGSTTTTKNPLHSYSAYGTYSVTLTAVSSNGCSNTLVKENYISMPEPTFPTASVSPLNGCPPLQVSATAGNKTSQCEWIFENNNAKGDSIHDYTIAGEYFVTMLFHEGGCTYEKMLEDTIQVYPYPTADFFATDTAGCLPLTTTVWASSQENISDWKWMVGGNVVSNSDSLNLVASAEGFVPLSLEVTNIAGCKTELDLSKKIFASGTNTSISLSDSSGCLPLSVTFSASGNDLVEWFWDFGNGITSTTATPTALYEIGGTYPVSLKTTNIFGCKDSLVVPSAVEVIAPLFYDVETDTLVGCESLSAEFNASQLGSSNWEWNFGDGHTATGSSASHTFTEEGTFTVSLSAISFNGCPFTIENYGVYIIEKIEPQISWIVDCPNRRVDFIDSTENATEWLWDFGDNSSSSIQNASHSYYLHKAYPVTYHVTTTLGCSKSFTMYNVASFSNCAVFSPFNDTIQALDSLEMEALLDSLALPFSIHNVDSTGNSIPVCVPYTLMFSSPYADAVSWLWNFGDGSTSTLPNPIHTYTTSGTFNLSVVCTKSSGVVKTLERDSFITTQAIYVNFSTTQEPSCTETKIQFTDASSDYAESWLYNFGDGSTSTEHSPFHSFSGSGIRNVSLNVSDRQSCSASTVKNVYVGTTIPYFSQPDELCTGETATFASNISNYSAYSWTFSDGITINSTVAQRTFDSRGEYQVTLTVYDADSCAQHFISPKSINVYEPVAGFILSGDTLGCDSLQMNISNTSTFASSFVWNFSDGSTSSEANPSHSFIGEGLYSISLTAHEKHCASTFNLISTVEVAKTNQAQFFYEQERECFPVTIHCSDSTSNAASWQWSFGDGSTSTEQNPSHTFTQKPTGKVKLTTTDINGCKSTKLVGNISLFNSEFEIKSEIGCIPRTVEFETSSTSSANYLWYFGDGNTSSDSMPTHLYSDTGFYSVAMVAVSEEGCVDSVMKPNLIQIEQLIPAYTYNFGTTFCAPALVDFSDLSVNANTWEWSFGDSTHSFLQNPSHVFNTPGSYDIKLIVGNSPTCFDSLIIEDAFTILGPTINYSIDKEKGCDSLEVQFNNTSENAVFQEWYFGDGNISTEISPLHSYSDTGIYATSIIAYDVYGCQGFMEGPTVSIYASANASFSVNQTEGCSPLAITFQNSSSNFNSSFWKFGDNVSSMATDPSHSYSQAGTYMAYLIANNSHGCRDTSEKQTITIYPTPTPTFYTDTTMHCPGSEFILENTTNLDKPGSYEWYVNGDLHSNQQSFTLKADSTGTYSITLYATNRFGCVDSTSISEYINIIELTPPAKRPVHTVTVISDQSVLMEWEKSAANDFSYYVIYRKNANNVFDTLHIEYNKDNTVFIDTDLNTKEHSYTYIVQTVDDCGMYFPISTHQPYSTIQLSTYSSYDAIKLSWTPYKGCSVSSYTIKRLDNTTGEFVNIVQVAAQELSYIDSIACPENYTYMIVGNELCGSSYQSASATKDGIPFGHSIKKQSTDIALTTVVNDDYISIEWEKPEIRENQVAEYHLYRYSNGAAPEIIATVDSATLRVEDHKVSVHSQAYHYFIDTKNFCAVKGIKGLAGSSILLQSKVEGFETHLSWTPYEKWNEGVKEYVIERLNADNVWEIVKVVDGKTLEADDNFKSLFYNR